MKKQIKSMITSYTFRIFIVFFTAACIFTSSISYAIFYKSNDLLKKEIFLSNHRLLKQIKSNTESYLVDKLNLVLDTCFVEVVKRSGFNTFVDGEQNNPAFHYQLFKEISQLVYINDFINDFAVYSEVTDTCIAQSSGLSYHYLDTDKYAGNAMHEKIKQAWESAEKEFWISPRENTDQKIRTITYLQKLPRILFPNDSHNGIVAVELDQEKLFRSIAEIYDKQGELFVVDQAGRLFAHSDAGKLDQPLDPLLLNEIFPVQEEELKMVAIDGDSYAMICLLSEETGLAYVSLIPFSSFYEENIQLLNFILIMLLAGFPIIILLFVVIARRLYRPFKRIVLLARHDLDNTSSNDPEFLENTFRKLSAKASQMDQFVRDNREILTIRLFHNLISGKLNTREGLNERLKFLRTEMKEENFYLLSIEMDASISQALTAEEEEFIKHQTLKYCLDSFADYGVGIADTGHRLLLLLNLKEFPLSVLTGLQQNIMTELGIPANFSLSTAFCDLKEVPAVNKAVTSAHKYHFLYKYGNLFLQDQVAMWEQLHVTLTIPQLDQLRKWIMGGDTQAAVSWITDYFTPENLKKMSYQCVQTNLMQIINIIASLLHNSGRIKNISRDELLNRFYEIENVEECILWLNGLFRLYAENNRENAENTALITKIQAYIQEHIEEDISLSAIASRFYLSESHLSRMFKETLQVNFSDYVIEKRLDRAARLLVTCKDLSVSDIMSRLGYTTQSYFSRIFKARFGVTPTQYRRQSLVDRDGDASQGQ